MIDEHLMRRWNEGHTAFSADIDRRLAQIAHRLSRRERQLFGIEEPYSSDKPARNTVATLLLGFAALSATALLFFSVGVLATPPAPVFA